MRVDPFAIDQAPVGEPLSLVVGTSAIWRKVMKLDDHSAYSIEYSLRPYVPEAGAEAVERTIPMAYQEGDTWAVDITQSDLSGWVAGRFFWDLTITRTADDRKMTLETGDIRVFTSVDDRRTHAQVMVDKIESLLENRADSDIDSYSIKSRSISKMSPQELLKWRDVYLREVRGETGSAGIFDEPRANKNSIRVRFPKHG